MHEFHPGGCGQRRTEVCVQRLAGRQRHRALEVQWSSVVLRTTLPVNPAQVIAQKVVEKALAPLENCAQFFLHPLPVFVISGNHGFLT